VPCKEGEDEEEEDEEEEKVWANSEIILISQVNF
jgi:hypothetical protein